MNFLRAFAQSPSPQLTDRQRDGGRERGMPEMMTMAPRTTDADADGWTAAAELARWMSVSWPSIPLTQIVDLRPTRGG